MRRTDGSVNIIAADRKAALEAVLGPTDELATLQGSELLDAPYLPLFPGTDRTSAPFTVIPAQHVTASSGTGLVHIAPAHGFEDYAALRALGLLATQPQAPENTQAQPRDPLVCHVDGEGRCSADVCSAVGERLGKELVGLEVLYGGSRKVIEMLAAMGEGVLVREEKVKHRYPYDWKTKKPIIVT